MKASYWQKGDKVTVVAVNTPKYTPLYNRIIKGTEDMEMTVEETRNYKREYKEIRRIAADIVKTADVSENHTLYLSFSKRGKNVFVKENKKFMDDAELDYDLGVISKDEYEKIKMTHFIIKRSIEMGEQY